MPSEYAIVPTESTLTEKYAIVFSMSRVTSYTRYSDSTGQRIPKTTEVWIGLEQPGGFSEKQIADIAQNNGHWFGSNTQFIQWRDQYKPDE